MLPANLEEETFHGSEIKDGILRVDDLRFPGDGKRVDGANAKQGPCKNTTSRRIHGQGAIVGFEFSDTRRIANIAGSRRRVRSENYRWPSLQDEDRPGAQENPSAGNLR